MTNPAQSLIPHQIGIRLLHDLDNILGRTAQEICQYDAESGALPECSPQETLLRRLAVVVKAGKILQLMENSLLIAATADPHIPQTAIAHAMEITQQAVSQRADRLRRLSQIPESDDPDTGDMPWPPPYEQIITLFAGNGTAMRAKEVSIALGCGTSRRATEGMRAKLRRLTRHGVLLEVDRGLFAAVNTAPSSTKGGM